VEALTSDRSGSKQAPVSLEQSISIVERQSCKILPIVLEIRKKLVKEESAVLRNEKISFQEDEEEDQADMRSVLGFLNQSQSIEDLNIGEVMQIAPVTLQNFMSLPRDEGHLLRDSILHKICLLIVSYFCIATEMRFQCMLKEIDQGLMTESEFWHAKALEIAGTFLPSDCPLLNHILLSYQKHHAPSSQVIQEDKP